MEIILEKLKIIKKRKDKRGLKSVSFVNRFYQPFFILFIIIIALFAKNNDYVSYPHILYWLGAFMALNLFANYITSKYVLRDGAADVLITLNCFIITAIVRYSGGLHSYLWLIYLLPIFTAAMLLATRELVATTILATLLLCQFYGNPNGWDYDILYEILIKFSLLFMGAMLMRSLVIEKNKVARELALERSRLDDMEEEFAEQNLQKLDSANMAEMGKRTSGIVHDLGTPMSVILGSARMMMKDGTFNRDDLQRIIDASLLCKNILTNALQIARGEDYKIDLLDIRDPLESAAAITMPILSKKNIEMRYNYQDMLPQMRGSYSHLERLFLNMFTNAKGAMPDGGEIFVNLKAAPDGKWIIVTYEDTGPGFPMAIITEGPKPFQTGRKAEGGTGLGLVVCKEIVEKHNGVFRLSNTNKGAKIDIHFPVKAD